MKKLLTTFLAITLTFFAFFINIKFTTENVFASENKFSSKASYLMDFNSNTVIKSNNENLRLQIASMTKIMLLLLAYENVDEGKLTLEEEIIISDKAMSMGGSQVFLESGGRYKVCELLKAITVASANDASVAIAERLYGSEELCVEEMNAKAKKLGLKNTLFANCTGLPKPMQYCSAKDIALIFKELIKHEAYFEYSNIWMDEIKHSKNSTQISNTNKLIKFYEGCDGGKTGFTSEAGFCLTATAKRGNMRLISVVIGAENSKERFNEVSSMFNEGFNNYSNKCVVDSKVPLDKKLKVKCGKINEIEVCASENFYVFSKRNVKENIELSYNFNEVKAPISKGDKVGFITIYKDGVEIGEVDILSLEDVRKMNYFDYVKLIIENA